MNSLQKAILLMGGFLINVLSHPLSQKSKMPVSQSLSINWFTVKNKTSKEMISIKDLLCFCFAWRNFIMVYDDISCDPTGDWSLSNFQVCVTWMAFISLEECGSQIIGFLLFWFYKELELKHELIYLSIKIFLILYYLNLSGFLSYFP